MAKTSQEIEKEFIESLNYATGKSLIDWMLTIKNAEIPKRNDIIKWLKENHNFGHMNASLLVGIYLNGGKPVYGSNQDLLEDQISKYEDFRSLFESVSSQILEHFPDAKMIPKKTYVSYTAKREFAAINIKSKEIRLGMDLGDKPYSEKLEKAKLTGPMPRISHMIMINDTNDFNKETLNWLEESYKRVNT